jgi:hypothetical protein
LASAPRKRYSNCVLEAFLPRYNHRFGVPAARTNPAYRPVDASLDTDGILCFKEPRRVGRDNTVQYHGQTLQLFPGKARRSYARTRVEVQRRLDGRLVKAGMDRARQQGKHIGRPRVTDRPEFIESYHTVLIQIREGTLSRRKAARQLDIGYASLKRLIDADLQSLTPLVTVGELAFENTCGTAVD